MSGPDEIAESPLHHGGLRTRFESEGAHGPTNGIAGGGAQITETSSEVRYQGGISRTVPALGLAHHVHDEGTVGVCHRPRRVGRRQHELLGGTSAGLERELEGSFTWRQPVRRSGQPHAIFLEAVAQAGLRDALAPLELAE